MGMADVIKKAAQSQSNAGQPAALVFGVVMTEEPEITIQVDGRFLIEKENIVIPKHLRKGEQWDSHKHKLFPPVAPMNLTGIMVGTDGGAEPSDVADHAHKLDDIYWTNNDDNTLKGREIYYGLKVGDKVALFRNAGGQQYYVMGVV